MTTTRRESNWTIPNLFTVTRLLLTPGFIVAFLEQRLRLAWVLFGVAGLTDALDGTLARLLRQRSTFGAMLDPLADKILLDTSFLCLAMQGWVPRWLTVIVVTRDVFIVGGLAFLQYSGVDVKRGIKPVWVSKCATLAQISLVLLVLVEHSTLEAWPASRIGLITAVAVLTVVSGAYYMAEGIRMFPQAENGRH